MTVTGKVVDERGAPIAGALIRTRVEFSEFREAVSGADGVYHLHGCDPPGMFGFVASAKGRATEVQERWIGPEAEPVDFRLKPGGVVRIRVIDAQGNPCLGARVHVFPEKFSPLFAFDSLNPDVDRAGRWEWREAPAEKIHANVDLPRGPNGTPVVGGLLVPGSPESVYQSWPCVMVSGTVIDRVTRQPVKSFRVFQGDDESSGRYAEEGRYQVRLYNQSHPNVVRIEAEGYQPASSREITEQKTARVDFELTKGQDVEGVVLTPAGSPAAGAKLAMTSGPFYGYSTFSISNGDLTGGAHGIEMRETDATGHFRFPPQDRDFFLLVIHPSGFVCFKPVPRSNYQRITLRPYARVEGTYRVAGKPVAGMRMILNASAHVEGPVARGPQIENRSRTTTGPDGRFAFEHVPAGSGSISGELKYTPHVGHAGAASACTVPLLEFSAGKVVKVDIGQHGRAVTARLKPPRGFAKPMQWQIATLDVEPAHYDRTAEYLSFKASVDHEGRFRVDDVPPGHYKLTCWSVQFGNDPPCTTSIVVPKQDIRPLGQLLDLGELELSKN